MLISLAKIANDLDKRGLLKEADILDGIIAYAATRVQMELTDNNVEEETSSGLDAFYATLSADMKKTLERLESEGLEEDGATKGCRDEHLSSYADGNVADSYISFLECIMNLEDAIPDLKQDASDVIRALRGSAVATEEQVSEGG